MKTLFKKTILVFLWPLIGFAATAPVSAYRVLHASPDDVVSALFSAYQPTSKISSEKTSRLEKYFRIKSKTIRNHEVTLELLPVVPIFEDYAPSFGPIKISMKQISQSANHFEFDSRFENGDGQFFNAHVDISPHESGSLLFLKLQDTNVSQKLVKLFYFTATQLGFVAENKETAIHQDQLKK